MLYQITSDNGHEYHTEELEATSEEQAREEWARTVRRKYGAITKRWRVLDILELEEPEE